MNQALGCRPADLDWAHRRIWALNYSSRFKPESTLQWRHPHSHNYSEGLIIVLLKSALPCHSPTDTNRPWLPTIAELGLGPPCFLTPNPQALTFIEVKLCNIEEVVPRAVPQPPLLDMHLDVLKSILITVGCNGLKNQQASPWRAGPALELVMCPKWPQLCYDHSF